MTQTLVNITNLLIPYAAGRGITETLGLVANGSLRRTVNGTLTDTTRVANRKFSYVIRCNDIISPTLAGIWVGQEVVLESAQPFRQFVNHLDSVSLIRPPVSNTVVGYNSDDEVQVLNSVSGSDAFFATPVDYVKFRPTLTMLVKSTTINNDEYGAAEGWEIDLEEV